MTNQNIDFNQLARWQTSAQKNGALLRVLKESAAEVFGPCLMPLAMAFHEASIASVYQQFGFVVFSPESRRLLAINQGQQTRTSQTDLLAWLDHAVYQQLADFHVLRYLETEPDWLELNHAFCSSVVKRLMVTRRPEWDSVGLGHFPAQALNTIMVVIEDQMDRMRRHCLEQSGFDRLSHEVAGRAELEAILSPSLEIWGRAIDNVLSRACQEPLRMLSWRLEAFTTETQLGHDSRMAVQSMNFEETESKAFRIICLMLVLSGFDFGLQRPVVSETPVSMNALVRGIWELFKSGSQASQFVGNFIGTEPRIESVKTFVATEVEMGEQLGAFRWTPLGNTKKGLLLTSLALQVITPYRELIESVFENK